MTADGDPAERDHAREPFLWLFVFLAVVVAVLVLADRRDDAVDATFAASETPDPLGTPSAEPQVLPTPSPTPVPDEAPAVVQVDYAVDAIALSGVAPAQEAADALVAAAGELVGAEAVTSQVVVDTETVFVGGLLMVEGEVADDAERARVLAAFADLGFEIDDRLQLAGSDATIADVLAADPELSQISDFLAAAGLLEELGAESEEGLTVFVPGNAAVESLDSAAFDEFGDAESLAEVLRFHWVPGRETTADLAAVTALASVQGESITIAEVDGALVVGGAAIVRPDIEATNGVVHVIDAVLLPGTLRTEVTLNEIVTQDPILFESGSAVILDESLPILDQVADLLRDNPLGRVQIQGHTDTDGPARVNRELSQDRADAVRAYLVDQGIDGARLRARGFGETDLAVDPEKSDKDKAANRRIEFRVT